MHFTVLHVDDDPNDAMFLRRAVAKARLPISLHQVQSGAMAIQYLSGTADFTDRHQHPFPNVMALDLKMPEISGFDVLEWIRRHPSLPGFPVIIVSSSDRPDDRSHSMRLGAHSFIPKTFDFKRVIEAIAGLLPRSLDLPIQPEVECQAG